MLAQRIKQHKQHHYTANITKVVTQTGAGLDYPTLRNRPCGQSKSDNGKPYYLGSDSDPFHSISFIAGTRTAKCRDLNGMLFGTALGSTFSASFSGVRTAGNGSCSIFTLRRLR